MKKEDSIRIADGLKKAAKIVLDKSQKYVPVDTTALKKSGRVRVTGTGLAAKATVEYGGREVDYALVVHERVDLHHAPPTSAKYLERAARESKGTITAMMKRQMAMNTVGVKKR